jgi:phosphotransferase family enzyme
MLPAVGTDAEWRAVVFDEKIVRPAAEDLAARLGLAGAGLRRYPGGSRPVYAVGDRRVLKLYPTVSAPDSVTEARVLDYLNGRLPVATPELLACGEYENGWRYLLMSQLPGTELAAAWPAYEFVAAGLFVSRGDPRLLGRILAAYGRSFDPRELLAYTLLHVHSNLPECLRELLAPPEPALDSLALTWFSTA